MSMKPALGVDDTLFIEIQHGALDIVALRGALYTPVSVIRIVQTCLIHESVSTAFTIPEAACCPSPHGLEA